MTRKPGDPSSSSQRYLKRLVAACLVRFTRVGCYALLKLTLSSLTLALAILANWWRETEAEIREVYAAAVVAALLWFSDKANVSGHGRDSLYPILVSLGNYTSRHREVCCVDLCLTVLLTCMARSQEQGAWTVTSYLPILHCKNRTVNEGTALTRIKAEVMHWCIFRILEPLRAAQVHLLTTSVSETN